MLGILYGKAKGKTCACIGATIRAVMKGKSILYVQFLRDDEIADKKAFSLFPDITELILPITITKDVIEDESKKIQAKTACSTLFDTAVKTVITRKFDMLVLDGVFDLTENGLLSKTDVYEFLSNAPNNLEIISTGISVDEKFLKLANYSSRLIEDEK